MSVLQDAVPVLISASVPGASGGLALFLVSFKNGHYKNNKYKAKLALELLGATIVATVIGKTVGLDLFIQ